MPNAITAIFGANSAQFQAELVKMQTVAIAAGRRISTGMSVGSHGPQGMTGIIRESTVIAREISMGRGMGRILGSMSLLIQYLKSYVTGAAVASTATEALAEKMEIEALQSKLAAINAAKKAEASAAAAYAENLENQETIAAADADALKAEEASANAAATEEKAAAARNAAEMENLEAMSSGDAAAATGAATLVFFAAVAAIVAVGVAVFMLYRHYRMLREEAKNLKNLLGPLNQDFRAHADAMRDAAKAHKDFLDHLKEIGDETESLPDKMDAVIKKLHEQTVAQIELMRAQGATETQIEGLKIKEIQSELDLAAIGKLKAERAAEEASIDYQNKEKAYNEGLVNADVLKSAKDKASTAGDILTAVQNAHDSSQGIMYGTGTYSTDPTTGISVENKGIRPVNDNDQFDVKVGDKEYRMSLAEAKKHYDDLSKASDDLASAQEQLKKDYEDAGKTFAERQKDAEKLSKAEQDYKDQLDIANKYGVSAAKAEDAKNASKLNRVEGYGLNSNQRIGAYAATPPVWQEQLTQLKEINRKTADGHGNRNAPPGNREPQLGTTPNHYKPH